MVEVEIQKSDASQMVKDKQKQMLIIEQRINKEVGILQKGSITFDQIKGIAENEQVQKTIQLLCEDS